MASLPTPRSYPQILGNLIDGFLSRYGIPNLRIGSPILSILESAAQSDFRATSDQLNFLKATSLENATGTGLIRLGLDEGLVKLTDTKASGSVTIADTSITKISTQIFQGQPAPIIGSTQIYVVDGSLFPGTGNVYLGRGTPNYEGPLPYTSVTNNGTYWTIALSGSTGIYHNNGDSVVLAQNGNRSINSGTTVQTPQSSSGTNVQFNTLFTVVIPDGETTIQAVQVSAVLAGVSGNVAAGAISSFVNAPFTGATVTNPLPITNATSQETDEAFRERIRATRATRTQGTALAIQTGVVGIISPDENKQVVSASLVSPQGQVATLFIDDGTGYSEIFTGVPLEIIVASALGGEKYFALAANPPVTKANVASLNSAPYTLVDGSELFVEVGGLTVAPATFSASEFQNIASASAYDVVSAINSQALEFGARVTDSGTTVTLFAQSDTNESIQVVPAGIGIPDANLALQFPSGEEDTIWLYKNDILLSKDGQLAEFVSTSFSTWTGFNPSSETLIIAADDTAPVTYTFTGASFAAANTGYTSVGPNSLAAWAAVFNAAIPGITATVTGSQLTLTSNLGRSARSEIDITGGTLVGAGKIFGAAASVGGADNDYTLDRNTGQLALSKALVAGDSLSAGSLSTRAFLQSPALAPLTVAAGGANLFFVVDGQASLVSTVYSGSTALSFTAGAAESWGVREVIQAAGGSPNLFSNVQIGDWIVLWDPVLLQGAGVPTNKGIFRVAYVDQTGPGQFIEVERSSMPYAAAGMQIVSLGNGANQVLVCGGLDSETQVGLNFAAVYTPATGYWTPVAPMANARCQHTATLMANGSVLVVGGNSTFNSPALTSCEIFSYTGTLGPGNIGSWSAAASLPVSKLAHVAFLLNAGPNVGQVVAVGGERVGGPLNTGYRYDPGSNTWTADGSLNTARGYSAVVYIPGTSQFLIAGGISSTSHFIDDSTNTAELYSQTSNTWTSTGSMATHRWQHSLTVLNGGTHVLVAGGQSGHPAVPVASAEIFDSGAGTWASTGSMASTRYQFALLTIGTSVLAVGGAPSAPWAELFNGSTWSAAADPLSPYRNNTSGIVLFNGTPLIVGGQNTVDANQSLALAATYSVGGNSWTSTTNFPVTSSIALTSGGMTIVRTAAQNTYSNTPQIQDVVVPAGTNYTASSLVAALTGLDGAIVSTYRTNSLRINTDTFIVAGVGVEGGDIALVAADPQGQLLNLPVGPAVSNLTTHTAAAVAGNSDQGTPSFLLYGIQGAQSSSVIGVNTNRDGTLFPVDSSALIVGVESVPDYYASTFRSRFGPNTGFASTIHDVNAGVLTLRESANVEWLPQDQVYAAHPLGISPSDSLTVVLNNDPENLRFTVPMYRDLQVVPSSSYGTTISVLDGDNIVSSVAQSLTKAFGFGASGFDFSDFAVAMNARALSNPGDAALAVLWRFNRLGADGNLAQIRYGYPTAPNQSVASVVTDFLGVNGSSVGADTNITVQLPSGAARTGVTIRPGSNVGVSVLAPGAGGNPSGTRYYYTYILGFSIATATSAGSGSTTLTLTLPPGVTNHGLVNGNSVYVASTNVGFASGYVTITGTTTNTITYNSTDGAGTASNIGTISFDTNIVTMTGSTVVSGDIVSILPTTSLASAFVNVTMAISSPGGSPGQYFAGLFDTGISSPIPTWGPIGNTAGLVFYPLAAGASTTTAIVAAVNAAAALPNSIVPVTAAQVGTGGTITQSSSDSSGTPGFYYQLADGLNFVQSTGIPSLISGNYTLTLKNPVSATLAGNPSLWTSENFRLMPITTANMVDWFNTPAVSGLYNNGSIVAADGAMKLQISTDTPGSVGSVQVQGGSANSVSAAVADFGTSIATADVNELVCSVQAAAASGITANTWMAIQNTITGPRQVIQSGGSGTLLTGVVLNTDNTATLSFSSGGTPLFTTRGTVSSQPFLVHKTGNFVCYQYANNPATLAVLSSVLEGDWVYIYSGGSTQNTTPSTPFRVVRVDTLSNCFWVENSAPTFSPEGVNQQFWTLSMVFIADLVSALPGDILKVSTPVWGPGGSVNQGSWQIVAVGNTTIGGTQYQNGFQMTVSLLPTSQVPAPGSLVSFSSSGVILTAAQAQLIQVLEGTPGRLIKYLTATCPNQADGALLSLKFSTDNGYLRVGVNTGSLIQPLDKLQFPVTIATGIDGYSHSTGLIEEANKVVYGDEQDPTTYPGVIASGANINISGPYVRRISISLAVRINTSVSTPADVLAQVQSSVAAVVNQTGIGQPIALSDIVSAAAAVNGVTSVTPISPALTAGNDLIAVQPFEKPMVLNLDTDVTVSIIGQ
jgi:hypothetical protein